jgi:hypothetical protein
MRQAALKLLAELSAACACVLALGLLAPALAAAAGSGGATSTWCTSAGTCTAVGTYTQSNGAQQGLLLSEVKGVWGADQLAALPAHAAANPTVVLNDLWCGAGPSCVAVGDYVDGSGNQEAMVLTEHDGAWSAATEVALPAAAISGGNQLAELNAVWCSSAANCVAVGDYTDTEGNQQGLTLTESGGHWNRGSATPVPGSAASDPGVALTALDCTSITACDVVGIFSDQEGDQEGEILVGAAPDWGYGEVVLPDDAAVAAQQVQLNALDCGSATSCIGAGAFTDSSGDTQPLILVAESGSVSTLQPALPANADSSSDPASQLTSVWCASAGNCSVVGDYSDNDDNEQGLLLTETNGSWSQGTELSLPGNTNANPQVSLNSLWCSGAGNCIAAGAYTDGLGADLPLLASQSGGSWGTASSPKLPAKAAAGDDQSAVLSSVFCAPVGDCATVGEFTDAAGNPQPLLISSTGGTWHPSLAAAAPPTTAALKTSLKTILATPSHTTLATVARRGYRYRYPGAEPGRLILRWYRDGVLVAATPKVTVTQPGTVALKITLTAAGRRAKAHTPAGGWSVSATASFTPQAPAGTPTVTATQHVKLR